MTPGTSSFSIQAGTGYGVCTITYEVGPAVGSYPSGTNVGSVSATFNLQYLNPSEQPQKVSSDTYVLACQ